MFENMGNEQGRCTGTGNERNREEAAEIGERDGNEQARCTGTENKRAREESESGERDELDVRERARLSRKLETTEQRQAAAETAFAKSQQQRNEIQTLKDHAAACASRAQQQIDDCLRQNAHLSRQLSAIAATEALARMEGFDTALRGAEERMEPTPRAKLLFHLSRLLVKLNDRVQPLKLNTSSSHFPRMFGAAHAPVLLHAIGYNQGENGRYEIIDAAHESARGDDGDDGFYVACIGKIKSQLLELEAVIARSLSLAYVVLKNADQDGLVDIRWIPFEKADACELVANLLGRCERGEPVQACALRLALDETKMTEIEFGKGDKVTFGGNEVAPALLFSNVAAAGDEICQVRRCVLRARTATAAAAAAAAPPPPPPLPPRMPPLAQHSYAPAFSLLLSLRPQFHVVLR